MSLVIIFVTAVVYVIFCCRIKAQAWLFSPDWSGNPTLLGVDWSVKREPKLADMSIAFASSFIFNHGLYKTHEKWVRIGDCAFVFGMELHADEKRVVGQFNNFN